MNHNEPILRQASTSHRLVPAMASWADSYEVPPDFPNVLATPEPQRPTLPRATWWLLGLVLLCLAPRAVMALKLRSVCPDGALYLHMAKALDQGNLSEGLRDLHLNTYPIALMIVHRAGLDWEVAGKLWGVVISSLVVLPLYGWVRRQFNERIARIACVLYAVHTEFIVWSPELVRDPTFWFFAATSIYLTWRAVTEVRLLLFVAAGVALGLASATRFEGLFLYLPAVYWSFRRWRALTTARRRLVLGTALCVAAFPTLLVLINATLLRGHSQWEWFRLSPLGHVRQWAESLTSSAPSAAPAAPTPPPVPAPAASGEPVVAVPAGPISLGRTIQIYVATLVRAFTPLFGLALLTGLWLWRRTWLRADHRGLGWVVLVTLAGIWIHLRIAQGSCTRFFLPVVLICSALAAMGLLKWSAWLIALAERGRRSAPLRWGAAALPWALVVGSGLGVSLGSDCSLRAGQSNLGHWIQREFGPSPVLIGTAGCVEAVNHYAQGRCGSFPSDAGDDSILDLAGRLRPDVILFVLTKRMTAQRCLGLGERLSGLGFRQLEGPRLPPSCEKMVVLARDRSQPRLARTPPGETR